MLYIIINSHVFHKKYLYSNTKPVNTHQESMMISAGCFYQKISHKMGCFVRDDKNGMGCFVRGDKNSMRCFVLGGKSLWDVLSRVSKNGIGCFVPGCFVRLPS